MERLRVIKAKLNSKFFMNKVFEAGKRYTAHTESKFNEILLDNDENLAVSLNIDAGILTKSEAHIRLRHKRDPAAVAAFRSILGKDDTSALASVAFTCKSEVNLHYLNEASKYLSVIMKSHMDNQKLPVEEFKWHTTEENDVRYLRASAVLPVEFSMMGAGLLGSVGVHDLALDLDFGLGCSRLTFKSAVSRGCIALVDDFIPNKDTKQFATFFLNYFCGAKLKFQFSSVEEAMTHFAASNFIKNHQDAELKNLVLVGQKLVNSQRSDSHLELLQHILDFFVSKPQRLQYFQAAWFATKCAKDNIERLTSITVVVGDELFEVDINIPKLFELLPNYEVAFNSGLFDKTDLPRKFVLSAGQAELLPQRKAYAGHEEHELILKNQLFEWLEDYWCDECDSFGSLWCYYCPECMYIVHPEHVINSVEQSNN